MITPPKEFWVDPAARSEDGWGANIYYAWDHGPSHIRVIEYSAYALLLQHHETVARTCTALQRENMRLKIEISSKQNDSQDDVDKVTAYCARLADSHIFGSGECGEF